MNNKTYVVSVSAASYEVRLFTTFKGACTALGLPYHYLKRNPATAKDPIIHSGYFIWRVSPE